MVINDVFVLRAVREIGEMIAVLDRKHALVCIGGMGEHIGPIRERIDSAFARLRLRLDAWRNDAAGTTGRVSSANSRMRARVIPGDEEHVWVNQPVAINPVAIAGRLPRDRCRDADCIPRRDLQKIKRTGSA